MPRFRVPIVCTAALVLAASIVFAQDLPHQVPDDAFRKIIFDFSEPGGLNEPAWDRQITLSGQVLSGAPNFFDNAVQVESRGLVRYRTHTNEMGEFSFEVPNDTYGLSVDLPEVQIAIFEVNSRNPAGE